MSDFSSITISMTEFNEKLKQNRDIAGTTLPVPYFLYVITQNDDGKLISMALSDTNQILDPKEITGAMNNNEDISIAEVITANISGPLQELYKSLSQSPTTAPPPIPQLGSESSLTSLESAIYQPASSQILSSSESSITTPLSPQATLTNGGSRKRHRRHKKKQNTKRRNRK